MLFISIHAPTRGATNITSAYVTTTKFQSTLPQEERLYRILYGFFCQNFNPRSHKRSDRSVLVLSDLTRISIHAPTRGATFCRLLCVRLDLFQSTLPQEERHCFKSAVISSSVFQSTLPQEERLFLTSLISSCKSISIHAPTRGATFVD